ncbi:unnamed protein product [Fraxinus pennsylvanica]|uniref:Coatomer subunit zeta n=1 Tax=Fraxinus pennsylvanica TaxID=56036 RepID=A0AAD1ZPN7_9LAMI|nr:unnamed protein product [Fraxinus pennsylvanica]
MLLAVLIANSEGNILVERFNGVPAEERLHWRSFLVKLGADNLKGVKSEELLVACHNGFKTEHCNISETSIIVCFTTDHASRTKASEAMSRSVYITYTVFGDVSIFVVGKDEYDELALAEAILVITSALKDVCRKPPTERIFLDKYGKICLCLDEIVWKIHPSFKINTTQNRRSCSFTVSIRTSCSSIRYTRDRISLAFGDAYGNQVYAPRLDDPRTGTFERCSTDTFEIYGPCTYQICYLYLYRSGYDGWIPYDVTVYAYNSRPVTFYYNELIPAGTWYGFDNCYDYGAAASAAMK